MGLNKGYKSPHFSVTCVLTSREESYNQEPVQITGYLPRNVIYPIHLSQGRTRMAFGKLLFMIKHGTSRYTGPVYRIIPQLHVLITHVYWLSIIPPSRTGDPEIFKRNHCQGVSLLPAGDSGLWNRSPFLVLCQEGMIR